MTELETRQLDTWIAEYIFGRKWYLFEGHIYQLEVPAEWQARHGGKLVDRPQGDGEQDISGVPKYSTEKSAAFEVLEKCITLTAIRLGTENVGEFSCGDLHDVCCAACIAPTLELAICLFAKKLFTK